MALFGSCYGERWSSVFSFLVCFLFVFYLTGGGASCSTAYWCIRFSFLCAGVFFSFICFSAFRGQASFFFLECGRWDSLGSGEKKTFI